MSKETLIGDMGILLRLRLLARIQDVERAAGDEDNAETERRTCEQTLSHMERFAREGLRTLLVTSADLDQAWFTVWDRR